MSENDKPKHYWLTKRYKNGAWQDWQVSEEKVLWESLNLGDIKIHVVSHDDYQSVLTKLTETQAKLGELEISKNTLSLICDEKKKTIVKQESEIATLRHEFKMLQAGASRLHDENLKYREALHEISDVTSAFKYPDRNVSWKDFELREIARKALQPTLETKDE